MKKLHADNKKQKAGIDGTDSDEGKNTAFVASVHQERNQCSVLLLWSLSLSLSRRGAQGGQNRRMLTVHKQGVRRRLKTKTWNLPLQQK
ncbi:hypothetical protein STCU_09968 [Strigomonas culicis]|uniref:Uncharacterized protein n=1 Tax=Strigomonas culicis TaxID=28005 RepID=S9TJX3_9TRYP|nr:hypothetical protein STCU_09968 [Strigomonas culicis]|eukprot:EPY18457.1 hypothetical protein STCU_09968 [Strigomonas culicis]